MRRFHLAIAAVTVLASTAFLLALMVIRADERREIAGILRLLGWSRARVLAAVLVEGVCVALGGAVAGVLLALGAEVLFNRFFQWHYDTPLTFVRIGPGIMLGCIALALPLGVGAGVVASARLLRGEIMALLRR
jgi:predicted lysophospholipase L1 biosynthesis ABC-type transport system permease subunit